MKNLWAPWRLAYILDPDKDKCFICHAVNDVPSNDQENLLVWRGKTCVCLLNRYPYNNGHLLICPVQHKAELSQLDAEEMLEIMVMAREVKAVITDMMQAQGFNLGMNVGKTAGAGLASHLHLHVVPRWEGDTNFMPVMDDTRVVPQALSSFYELLYPLLQKRNLDA